MGFIRGSLLVIVTILLFLSLFIGNIFLTLSLSLHYDNVGPELVSSTKDIFESQLDLESLIGKQLKPMELSCQTHSEFVFTEMGNTFIIPCDIISQGSEVIIDYAIESIVEQIYYAEYGCEFWDCLEKTGSPSFLTSEKAKNYWNTKFYFLLMISIAMIVLMFFLIVKKTSLPILVGSLLIISSLPLMKLESFIGMLINPALSIAGFSDAISISLLSIFPIFFSQSRVVFLIMSISGIILLCLGIILKLFKVGLKISNFLFQMNKKKNLKKIKKVSKKNEQKNIKETKEIPKKKKKTLSLKTKSK